MVGRAPSSSSFFWMSATIASRFFGSSSCDCRSIIFWTCLAGRKSKNVSKERQQAALSFLKWFQTQNAQVEYTKAGSPPVRLDVLGSEMASKPEFRWMKAMREGLPLGRQMWKVPEGAQIVAILELKINQAITGELSTAAALNTAAREIEDVMAKGGYKTGRLPDLG